MVFNTFLRQFDTDFYAKLESELFTQIDKDIVHKILETKINKLSGKDFFIVFNIISSNFDQDCQKGFDTTIKHKKKEYLNKTEVATKSKIIPNKFTSYVSQLIIQQSDIANLAYIESSRFSKILNEKFTDFYAFEVILLANICNLSPFILFNYFYGDGERPIVGVTFDVNKEKSEK